MEHHRAYLRYDVYLARGFPIATGVIEGACRHLTRDRLTLTGARRSLDGAEAILRLRALRASGDRDACWPHHERKEYERNHAARYADDNVPSLTPLPARSYRKRQRTLLRIVKSSSEVRVAQRDPLVGHDAALRGDRAPLDHVGGGPLLHPRAEEDPCPGQPGKPLEVEIPAIENQ